MRIHMARKLLAAAGAQLPPDTPHSLAAAMLQQQQQQQEQKHQQQQQMLQLHEQHVQQADDSKQQQQQEQQPTNAAAAAAAALGILSARGAALSSSSSDGCRVSNSSSSSGGNCQTPGSSGDVISSTSCEAQTELNGLLQHNTCEDAAPALDAQQQQQQLSPSEDLPLLPAQQQQQIVSASSSAEQLQEVDAACQLPSPPQVQHIEDDQLQQAQEALPADDMHVTEQQQQQQQLLQHGGSSMPDGEPGGTCSEQAGDGQWSGELDVPRLLAAESNNAGGSVQSAHEPVTGQSALCDAETHQLVYGTGAVAAGTDGSYAADCSAQQELPALCADPCTPAAAPASAELHSAGTAGTDVDEVVDGLLNALVLAVEADEGSRVVDQLLLQLLDELECSC
jgi:chemotaxis protein histidine kinase CheA